MSVKALKALLAEKSIPCGDCVEKADLIQRLLEKQGGRPQHGGRAGPSFAPRPREPAVTERAPSASAISTARAAASTSSSSASQKKRLDPAQEIERLQRRGMTAGNNPWGVLGIAPATVDEARKRYKLLCLALHADKVPKHLAKPAAAALLEVQRAMEKVQEQGTFAVGMTAPAAPTGLRYERIGGGLQWTVLLSWNPPEASTGRPVDGYRVYARIGMQLIDQGEVGAKTGEAGRVEFALSATRPHNAPLMHRRNFEVLVQATNRAGRSAQLKGTVNL